MPHMHSHSLGQQRYEVVEGVVSASSLRHIIMRFRLHSVDQIGKLDGVLYKKDGDVISHQIEVAVISVEFDGEPSNVSDRLRRSLVSSYRRKTHEHGRLFSFIRQEVSAGDVGQVVRQLENSVCGKTASVDYPLGDPLVIEMGHFLAIVEVF